MCPSPQPHACRSVPPYQQETGVAECGVRAAAAEGRPTADSPTAFPLGSESPTLELLTHLPPSLPHPTSLPPPSHLLSPPSPPLPPCLRL